MGRAGTDAGRIYFGAHVGPLPALRRRVVRRVESLSRRRRQGAALPSRRERQAFRRDGPQTLHGRTARRNLRRDVPHGGQGQRAVRTSLRDGCDALSSTLGDRHGCFPGCTPRQRVHGVRLRLACRSLFQGGHQTDSRDRESRL